MDSQTPAAPWRLTGSALITLTGARPKSGVLLAFVHYETSPVGTYEELARFGLTSKGPSVLEMFVNSPDSMGAGRRNWGFPKEFADLQWQQRGRHTTFRAGTTVWRFRACGPSFALCLSTWSAQQLEGKIVKAPVIIRGSARFAFSGRRLALQLTGFEMQVLEAEELS